MNKQKIEQFIKIFREYNMHTNLMSQNEVSKLAEKHIPDCLGIEKFFKKYNIPKNMLDVGCGGGLPSIPIATAFEEIRVVALDSTQKKINFVNEAKQELCLNNLFPVCSRIEDFEQKEGFDVVTTRAVANLSVIAEYCAPFTKIDGYIIAYKSKTANNEIKEAETAFKILGLKFVEKINYKISEDDDYERSLVILKKIKRTPKNYPRKNNSARKIPL